MLGLRVMVHRDSVERTGCLLFNPEFALEPALGVKAKLLLLNHIFALRDSSDRRHHCLLYRLDHFDLVRRQEHFVSAAEHKAHLDLKNGAFDHSVLDHGQPLQVRRSV